MSTLIGSQDTNIYMEPGVFRLRVGGDVALDITDPGSTGGFAERTYVDQQNITDLAP